MSALTRLQAYIEVMWQGTEEPQFAKDLRLLLAVVEAARAFVDIAHRDTTADLLTLIAALRAVCEEKP